MTFPSAALVLAAWWIAAGATAAHAYLDAGSGSMMLQLLLGGLAGLGVALRLYWRRLLELVGLRRAELPAREPDTTPAAGGDAGDPHR